MISKKSHTNFIAILFFVIFCSPSFAQLVTEPTGGPDLFGHKWITSLAPGTTIDYQWIEVRSDSLAQLTDDSFVGPLNIGFTFNYYGTDYTQFYIS